MVSHECICDLNHRQLDCLFNCLLRQTTFTSTPNIKCHHIKNALSYHDVSTPVCILTWRSISLLVLTRSQNLCRTQPNISFCTRRGPCNPSDAHHPGRTFLYIILFSLWLMTSGRKLIDGCVGSVASHESTCDSNHRHLYHLFAHANKKENINANL